MSKLLVDVPNSDNSLFSRLRKCLNSMLCKTPDGLMAVTQTRALHNAQRKIQSCLVSLLERPRRMEQGTVLSHNLVNRLVSILSSFSPV